MGDWKMFQLVKNYVEKMSKKDLNDFAIKNGVYLSESELDFTYNFVKRNYETLYNFYTFLIHNNYKSLNP